MPAGGDLGHVPNHRPLRVEVSRSDQEKAATAILRCNGIEKLLIYVESDEVGERPGIGERVAAQHSGQWFVDDQIARTVAGPHVSELRIVGRTEESKWRDQSASAHARNDLEPWAAPGVCPAHEQTRAKSTILTAARNSKQVDNRLAVFRRRLRQPRHVGQSAVELVYSVGER